MELSLFLLLLLALLSGFFSCAEIAFFSLPTARIRSYRNSQVRLKRTLAELLSDSRGLLVTIFTANTIANILLQNVASDLSPHESGDFLIKIVAPFLIMLLFGEFLPKYIGLMASSFLADIATYPIWYLKKIFHVVTRATIRVSELFAAPILSLFTLRDRPSEDEIEALLKTQSEHSPLTQDEAKFIHNFLEIDRLQVKEVMLPRHLIESITLEKFNIEKPLKTEHDILLVVDEALDKPIGAIGRGNELTPLIFIPETSVVGAAFFSLIQGRYDVGCIVDEYGVLVGVVTQADLFLRLFGQIHPQNPLIEKISKNILITHAQLPLSVINDHFSTALKSSYHSVTINGLLCEVADEIPRPGQVFHLPPLTFTILKASGKKVLKVKISLLDQEKSLS